MCVYLMASLPSKYIGIDESSIFSFCMSCKVFRISWLLPKENTGTIKVPPISIFSLTFCLNTGTISSLSMSPYVDSWITVSGNSFTQLGNGSTSKNMLEKLMSPVNKRLIDASSSYWIWSKIMAAPSKWPFLKNVAFTNLWMLNVFSYSTAFNCETHSFTSPSE